MSTAATQQTPVVPPRPSKAAEKEAVTGTLPKVPPRPTNKRPDRPSSPNPDRFAPSPFSGGVIAKNSNHGQPQGKKDRPSEPVDRTGSVSMPTVGEEGAEYNAVPKEWNERHASLPEPTHSVAVDLKLHSPRPSLPAVSAKKQVMAVTRTDSERAAAFGIGRPASNADERTASRNSNKRRPGSSYSAHSDHHTDDEHGIPEIGQRVPMNPRLGDVQAPSPSPGLGQDGVKKNHGRKHSARGVPPGSYGLHGHGVAPQDKLEKAYYQKHPDILEREQHTPLHDRQNDFAMSSSDLNKLVRDTANRQSALGKNETGQPSSVTPTDRTLGTTDFHGTPTDEVAFQASEEYTSRISASAPSSAPLRKTSPHSNASPDEPEKPIHVDDARHPELYQCGDEADAAAQEDEEYKAPILASDEVNKDPVAHSRPAVYPHHERRDSMHEMDEPLSRPTSRPSSVRAINHPPPDFGSTPLEDVEEYEPLFTEEVKEEKPRPDSADENESRHHFPSKDIWEDAPSSVHYTALVSTPDVMEQGRRRSSAYFEDRPITPAQAFAQYQEQLAESEANSRSGSHAPSTAGPSAASTAQEEKPSWIDHHAHLSPKKIEKVPSIKRFPSRDVWEDAPESQLHEAIVSGSPTDKKESETGSRSAPMSIELPDQPVVPDRPKARQSSADSNSKPKPPLSDKPKPHVPPRPSKTSPGDSKDAPQPKVKPAVPSRPVGGKIAALQAGFMSDLNKRLQLGPHAPKKEEEAEPEVAEEKEKAPLSDARKGRARGPQRRAPAKGPALAAATKAPPPTTKTEAPTLTLSLPQAVWTIDPDDGDIALGTENAATPDTGTESEETAELVDRKLQQASPESSGPGKNHRKEHEAQTKKEAELAEQADKSTPARETSAEEPEEETKKDTATEEKTLVANMAGESILEASVKKGTDGDDVEPLAVHDDVKA
ncbi:hypothetical protein L249_8489 [Ophiocordyceps polyrhachis-furcata BCC 54312]|uniref:Altered inheritance of mitochondria protein 21 n=1 Tax=Ophiocordyceps polyrhachis-furcata BCC 54312 TaxID=1330021 RepID=A0A367L6D4_9HYPO|nr:hypothetical protein L249_8489 [Ophiocordyceps polyrhachis-furcata BCC 54312]